MPRWEEAGRPFRSAVDEYMEHGFRGKSMNTVRCNQSELNRFYKWGCRHWQTPSFGVDQIGERDMAAYLDPVRPPKRQPTSFNNRRQMFVRFYKFCRDENWVSFDPMRREGPYKVQPRKKLWLSASELLTMIDNADPRDRMALALGMQTGLRAQDAMSLKIGDMDLRGLTFDVWIQKTSEWATKPITDELYAEIMRWLPEYASLMGLAGIGELNDNWRLVPRWHPVAKGSMPNGFAKGRPSRVLLLPDQTVMHPERIVHRALDGIGITPEAQKGAGFHSLRRSAARLLYDVASDSHESRDAVGTVQAFLNHQQRSTTEIYIGTNLQQEEMTSLLRGKSFLGTAADIQSSRVKGHNDDDETGTAGLAVAR